LLDSIVLLDYYAIVLNKLLTKIYKGDCMKKGIAVSVCVIAVLALCVVSAGAWTGRMSGMGGPYGLVEDESDFLTHPAVIPQGKGLTFYGDLSFFKKDVQKWDVSVNLGNDYAVTREADGDEWNADTRLGFALPLGVGRMGVFFEYSGNFISRGGRYRGNGADYIGSTTASPGIIDVRNENDSIAVRVLYAQPAFDGKAKLGGEFSIGYVTETSSVMTDTLYGTLYVRHNYHWDNSFLNGFAYALPYSSRYWEAKMKASVETMIGASKLSVTPFGGFILDGDNRYDWDFGSTAPWLIGTHEGSVSGYHLGTEAWWRLPVNKSISIPILAKAVYSEKKRDGDGTYLWSGPMYDCDYGSKEKALNIEIGGGIDAQIGRNSRFAGGLYYGYIDSKNDFFFIGYPVGAVDYPSHPKWKEDRITLKLAAETEISPKSL
jgi:hypothetical protein